jgi:hypothetical protein
LHAILKLKGRVYNILNKSEKNINTMFFIMMMS